MSPATASRRRLIRRFLEEEPVSSQHQLVELLAASGHAVTQATVSRDLEALGAVKTASAAGEARYEIPETGAPVAATRAAARAIADFVESIVPSGNLVVLSTPPGAAHLVAGAIDHADVPGVLGTVAGDDTLLVVADDSVGGKALAGTLENIGA